MTYDQRIVTVRNASKLNSYLQVTEKKKKNQLHLLIIISQP